MSTAPQPSAISSTAARPDASARNACSVTKAFSPLGRRANFAAFDARKKCARQARLARIALAVHRAQIEELVAQRVALAILVQNGLQGKGQFAQLRRLGPGTISSSSLVTSRSENSPRLSARTLSRQARS